MIPLDPEGTVKVKPPIRGEVVRAVYQSAHIKEYVGNPLIESLPMIGSFDEVKDALNNYPEWEDIRALPSHLQPHALYKILKLWQTLDRHITLESDIAITVRQGYVSRNPLDANTMQLINNPPTWDPNAHRDHHSRVSGFSIIGVSGMGKSTTVERILTTRLPQVIQHIDPYRGRRVVGDQVVWMKLDCPHDGSVKGLCLQFFAEIDDILGYDSTSGYQRLYVKQHRAAAHELIPEMSQIGLLHHLGLLVIDEIQNLNAAASGGQEKMLNFFVTLSNTFHIPIIMVGTPKAQSLLNRELQLARRSEGIVGDTWWMPYRPDEPSWNLLLDALKEYNFVDPRRELSSEVRKSLWRASCGIVDFAIKLFVLAQLRALNHGDHELTASHISSVAHDHLNLAGPILRALRSGKRADLRIINDLHEIDLRDALYEEARRQRRAVTRKTRLKDVAEWLEEAQIDHKTAIEAARRSMKSCGLQADLSLLKARAMAESLRISDSRTDTKDHLPPNEKKETDDGTQPS